MPFCAYCGSQVAEASYRLCPACGNPANGAPRTELPAGGQNTKVIVIVVIVLVLVLAVPVAGILAAIAIPNYLTAVQRSKQKRTMVEIRTIATDAEAHANAHGQYPKTVEPRSDGWDHPLRYECLPAADGQGCAGYAIASAGKDGVFEQQSNAGYTQGGTTKFDCDIVYANGSFLQYPEGVTP